MSLMSTSAKLRIAFDGTSLSEHQIDVQDLAPALMGLGEIFNEANRVFNDKKCHIRVCVTPDMEKKCFDIGLKIIQDNWTAVSSLFTKENIETAEQIIDWIFRTGAAGGLVWTLVHYNKKPVNVINFKDENGNPYYRYQFKDKEDLVLDHKQHILYENNVIRKGLKKLLSPIINNAGISDFYAYKKEHEDGVHVTKKEAQSIEFVLDSEPEELTQDDNTIDAWLSVYSPVYDMKPKKWRFWYGDNHYYMNIENSGIKELVISNGGALIGDKFRVKLQITQKNVEDKIVNEYKIVKVLEFKPSERQGDMFSEYQRTDNTETSNS